MQAEPRARWRKAALAAVAVGVGLTGLAALAKPDWDEHAGGLTLAAGVAAAAVVGRVWHDRLRGGWTLLALGSIAYAGATAALFVVPSWPAVDLPFPSAVDGAYIIAYGLYAGFLLALIRDRDGDDVEDHRLAYIDATIFTLTLMVVLWETLIEVNDAYRRIDLGDKVLIVVLTSIAALVFALAVRLVIGGASRVLGGLVLGWAGLELVSAVAWAFARASEDFHHAGFHHGAVPPGVLRIGSAAALAALAVHPRMGSLSTRPLQPLSGRGIRIGILLAASLVPLAAIAQEVGASVPQVSWLTVVSGVVFSLIILRLAVVTVDLHQQRRVSEELRLATEELRYRSWHDPLTGAGNRTMLLQRLDHALQRRADGGRTNALLLLDLDGFKTVNDTLGHRAGDDLLTHVAGKLRGSLRSSDTVARIGGDEFGVLLENVTASEALRATRRLVDELHDPFVVEGRAVRTRASVGVYFADEDAHADIAMRNADLALYAAKGRGGERYEVFEPALHEAFLHRHELELELRAAADAGQLRLHYQPVVNLEDGRVDGTEALVRWQHPERGLIFPGEFMGVAEESGIIIEIGRWVLTEACRQFEEWRAASILPEGFQMAVNLSRRQLLDPKITADVETIIQASGASPSHVIVEVTETALMSDTAELTERLRELSAIGVGIAMDDFGTGYSSLDQLRKLPIDILKIDRAFVEGIDRGPEDFALATAIVKLAASLGKETLAEGVETPAQLAHLRSLRAGRAQGYLFARPLHPDGVPAFLQKSACADQA